MENFDCKDIITFLESKPHFRVENEGNQFNHISLIRSEESWIFDLVESKLSPKYKLTDNFRGLKYTEGDFMTLHTDGQYSHAYLSGGILDVSNGEVFTFSRNALHEITPIESGIRYSLHFHIALRELNTI